MPEGLEQSLEQLSCVHINTESHNYTTTLARTLGMVTDAVSTIPSFSGQGELGEARSVLEATQLMS